MAVVEGHFEYAVQDSLDPLLWWARLRRTHKQRVVVSNNHVGIAKAWAHHQDTLVACEGASTVRGNLRKHEPRPAV